MRRKSNERDQISVRLARPEDAERVAALCGQLGYPASHGQVKQRLDQIQPDEGSAVFVAERSDGEAIGWVQVGVRQLVVADRQAEVEGLVVDEDCRRSRVGLLLLERAEQWARAKGCSVVCLRSNVVRKEARPFYEGSGYTVVKTQWAFRKVLGAAGAKEKR